MGTGWIGRVFHRRQKIHVEFISNLLATPPYKVLLLRRQFIHHRRSDIKWRHSSAWQEQMKRKLLVLVHTARNLFLIINFV